MSNKKKVPEKKDQKSGLVGLPDLDKVRKFVTGKEEVSGGDKTQKDSPCHRADDDRTEDKKEKK